MKGQYSINASDYARSEFYKQAKSSFVVVHTGETALYGNIIITKGVVAATPEE